MKIRTLYKTVNIYNETIIKVELILDNNPRLNDNRSMSEKNYNIINNLGYLIKNLKIYSHLMTIRIGYRYNKDTTRHIEVGNLMFIKYW